MKPSEPSRAVWANFGLARSAKQPHIVVISIDVATYFENAIFISLCAFTVLAPTVSKCVCMYLYICICRYIHMYTCA